MKQQSSSSSRQPDAPVSFTLHKATHDPRAAALVAVSRVLAGEADAQEALDQALRSGSMVPTDKGLCTELVYGHLRMRLRLHWFCGRFLRKPDKLPWEMRLCLEQALYAMAFLRIPHRATVHWAVEHIRHRFGQSLARVANGALRSMQRELAAFTDETGYGKLFSDTEEALACLFSMPVWIVRLWMRAYGPEQCRMLLEISSQGAPQGLRLNMARPGWERKRQALLAEARPVGEAGLLFEQALPFAAKQLLASGEASRQGAGSYAILEFFEPRTWPRPVWDCCAGRGGKTLALLERGVPVALASDPSKRRLGGLPDEYRRLGLTAPALPVLLAGPATGVFSGFTPLESAEGEPDFAPVRELPEEFGAILVDAPCSGLGTLGRRPEIRYRRSPKDCAKLAALQKDILQAAWARLLPGGRLIYITCTANPEENEGQIAAFLAGHPDARLLQEYPADRFRLYKEYFYGAMLEKGQA